MVRRFERYILDPRDLPFLSLMAKIALTIPPFALALFVPGVFRWWLGAIYVVYVCGVMFPPFTLMLHCTSHRPLFKKQYARWNGFIPWVLSPFLGQTPQTYTAHHMGMHHAEANLWEDESSTLPYQRDSLRGFLHYFFTFMFRGLPDLVAYLRRKGRNRLATRAVAGELGFWAVTALLLFVNPPAALCVLVIPVLFARFGMMAGNWAQHAFVDASSPENSYRNSITCIEVGYNERCFNDGYHIGHHLQPKMHWTEMPGELERNRARYLAERALVFRGVDYFVIWALLMLKQHRRLAAHLVSLDGKEWPIEARVKLMRERLTPVVEPVENAQAAAA